MLRSTTVLRGSLGRVLAGCEPRKGQLAMAEAVEDALARERSLIVEAGTGTGKTLAYLIPAALSGKRVIVSTATLTLQEQIWKQDLPLVAEVLKAHGIVFEAALMKGLSNYVCKRRMNEAAAEDTLWEGERLHQIRRWAETSDTGDRADLDLAEDAPLWSRVMSASDTRIGSSCKFYEECFVTRMKRRAERARIVVVNHHLFCADLALRQSRAAEYGAAVLPPHDAIVFDEAHQLEEVATDSFGLRVSTSKIDAMIRDARRAFTSAGRGNDPRLQSIFDQIDLASRAFFGALVLRVQTNQSPRSQRLEAGARKLLARDAWSGDVLSAMHKLDASMEALAHHADAIASDEAIELIAMRATRLRAELAEIVDGSQRTEPLRGDSDDFPIDEPPRPQPSVAWIELRDRTTTIGASRVDIGRELHALVWRRVPTVIMTSATLATTGPDGAPSFSYVRSRLGAPEEAAELWVPSPFDFERRAGLYVASDLPDPGHETFDEEAAARVIELVDLAGGGAFVLCTSTRAMTRFFDALRAVRKDVFVQGQAPKHQLLERFRAHGDAVLVATMSFWEGVDVPGAALRLVILDRIPFSVPTDPVVMARTEAITRAGGDAFVQYTVPAAGILLKQGFGRLIRSTRDAGVVALLDRRLVTRGYGRSLLSGLPPAKRLHTMAQVRTFFAEICANPAPP